MIDEDNDTPKPLHIGEVKIPLQMLHDLSKGMRAMGDRFSGVESQLVEIRGDMKLERYKLSEVANQIVENEIAHKDLSQRVSKDAQRSLSGNLAWRVKALEIGFWGACGIGLCALLGAAINLVLKKGAP